MVTFDCVRGRGGVGRRGAVRVCRAASLGEGVGSEEMGVGGTLTLCTCLASLRHLGLCSTPLISTQSTVSSVTL